MPRLAVTYQDARKVRATKVYHLRPDGDTFARAVSACQALKATTDAKIVRAVLEFDVAYTDLGEAVTGSNNQFGAVQDWEDQATNDVITVTPCVKPAFVGPDGEILDVGDMAAWIAFFAVEGTGPFGAVITSYLGGTRKELLSAADDLNAAAASVHPAANPTEWYAEDGADVVVMP